MKIRNGFVSNSSSSSFLCNFCGRQETGYDLALSEAEMLECQNGHCFCQDEMIGGYEEELFEDYENRYSVEEKYCPVCNRKKEMQKDPEYNEYKKLWEKFNHVDPEGRIA